MQVKNQLENAKLIMLNNKASIDNGSWFFYSISNKTKVNLKIKLLHVFQTVIVIVINRVYFNKNLELHIEGWYESNGCWTGGGVGWKDFLPAYKWHNNGVVGTVGWEKGQTNSIFGAI
jgi:hypothetical protein